MNTTLTRTRITVGLTPALALGIVVLTYSINSHGQTNFTRVTSGAIVNDGGVSASCAWGDYDNDGNLDLFVSNADIGAGATNFLYHNNGDGTFNRVTSGVVANLSANSRGSAWIDYDNDGNLDLSVMTFGTRNLLFRNNGDGTFTKQTNIVIFTDLLESSEAGSWADFDGDGFVDLFVSNANGVRNFLYRNSGDSTFTKITAGNIVNDIGAGSHGSAWADYNNDGRPDLFVSNLQGRNFQYQNTGQGTFRAVTGTIVTTNMNSISCAWGDYDNDGFLDLFVTNDGILDNSGIPCLLSHNNGDGTFSRAVSAGMAQGATRSPGCAWGDYDNDGFLDLLVLNVDNFNTLYHNEGNGTFTRVTQGPIVETGGPGFNSTACSWADYDNDGFLDLFIANGAGPFAAPINNFLFHNSGNSNGWLKIKCIGTVSNRSAIGTKVRIKATIWGKERWQMREVTIGDGFTSGSPLDTHFGLGDATNVDIVRIEWISGAVQEFRDMAPRQSLTIMEPARLQVAATGGAPRLSIHGGRGFQYDIQSSTNLMTWSLLSIVTITNFDGSASIPDALFPDPSANVQFYRGVLR